MIFLDRTISSVFWWQSITKHCMDAPGTYPQWCTPRSSGFSGLSNIIPLTQVTQPGWSSPDLRPSSYPRSVPLGKDRATQSPPLPNYSVGTGRAIRRMGGLGTRLTAPGTLSRSGGLSRNGSAGSTGRETVVLQAPLAAWMALLKALPWAVGRPPHGRHSLGRQPILLTRVPSTFRLPTIYRVVTSLYLVVT